MNLESWTYKTQFQTSFIDIYNIYGCKYVPISQCLTNSCPTLSVWAEVQIVSLVMPEDLAALLKSESVKTTTSTKVVFYWFCLDNAQGQLRFSPICRLHRCWWWMLETVYVGELFELNWLYIVKITNILILRSWLTVALFFGN